jgi:hypothetical protein
MVDPETSLHLLCAGTLTLRLYSNALDPDTLDALRPEDFAEVQGGGYAPQVLSPAGWTITGTAAEHGERVFALKGQVGPVGGYYVTTPEGRVLQAECFRKGGEPYDVVAGGKVRVVPRLAAGGT